MHSLKLEAAVSGAGVYTRRTIGVPYVPRAAEFLRVSVCDANGTGVGNIRDEALNAALMT